MREKGTRLDWPQLKKNPKQGGIRKKKDYTNAKLEREKKNHCGNPHARVSVSLRRAMAPESSHANPKLFRGFPILVISWRWISLRIFRRAVFSPRMSRANFGHFADFQTSRFSGADFRSPVYIYHMRNTNPVSISLAGAGFVRGPAYVYHTRDTNLDFGAEVSIFQHFLRTFSGAMAW